VLYFDSSATCMQDSLWAPEAFSQFYALDTQVGAWNEYMRFAAAAQYGYELYAIGDTTDMKANVGLYVAIIRFVKILNKDLVTLLHFPAPHRGRSVSYLEMPMASSLTRITDLLGKRIVSRAKIPAGVYCMPEQALLNITDRR
jgi:hypothetical protein